MPKDKSEKFFIEKPYSVVFKYYFIIVFQIKNRRQNRRTRQFCRQSDNKLLNLSN